MLKKNKKYKLVVRLKIIRNSRYAYQIRITTARTFGVW